MLKDEKRRIDKHIYKTLITKLNNEQCQPHKIKGSNTGAPKI